MRLRLYCATGNPGKLAEFRQAAPHEIEILAARPFDCPETRATFQENAAQKALCYARHLDDLVFADDSGLEVDALDGAPGVRSARFAGPGATDAANRALLLAKLCGVERPRARFVCALALARRDRVLAAVSGAAEGEILSAERGTDGFGYDPLFYYPPLGRTFAELTAGEKFAHSHRGRAFRALLAWLESHFPRDGATTVTPAALRTR